MSYLYITSIIKEEYHMNDILKELKETATNVLNANENARKRKEAEKRAKRNALLGVSGIVAGAVACIYTHCAWRKRYMSLETRLDHVETVLKYYESQDTSTEGGGEDE